MEEVEDKFQAMQRAAVKKPVAAAKQKLAVLDLKRATAVGIRMSRLRYRPMIDFVMCSHQLAIEYTFLLRPTVRQRF